MRILVAEDEPSLRGKIAASLQQAGYVVDSTGDGTEALHLGETEPYDAAVLDLGLPGLGGVAVLRAWRAAERKVPVLVLTARGRWVDKLAAFEAGADDYMVKPFEMAEAIVRLKSLIRRSAGHASPVLTCGPLRLDTARGTIDVDGVPVKLTAQEHRIVAYLLHHKDRVVSRTELTEHVYDRDFDLDSNVIDVLVGRIRRKLGVDVLHTVRGLGFRLAATPP